MKNAITFEIEPVEKAQKLLATTDYSEILKKLEHCHVVEQQNLINFREEEMISGIVAKSKITDPIVDMNFNPFFNGMYAAYAEHRPFVLSPDMIWLLISQGFARHVNNNAEALRKHFVKHDGKLTLLVVGRKIFLNNPDSPWEEVFPEFTKQIGEYVGKDLVDTLSANFSTTGTIEKVASEITIMETMKSYFDYLYVNYVCGIPEVTIEGNTADWQKILEKARFLRKYELDWWIDKLEPLLKEFINASKGEINKEFWINIFKYHTLEQYGSPKIIDGWILKFFPYDKDGNKTGDSIHYSGGECELPPEIVKTDLEYKLVDGAGNILEEETLELWAGFVGLEQNNETMALRPKIGWMIRKKNVKQPEPEPYSDAEYHLRLRIDKVPDDLLKIKYIHELELEFINKVKIPKTLIDINIETLKIQGRISPVEIFKVLKLFPYTFIKINKSCYPRSLKGTLFRFLEGTRYVNIPFNIVSFPCFLIGELFKSVFKLFKRQKNKQTD